MAGGVALNGVANYHILKSEKYQHLFIQPAAGDSGGSMGAALSAYTQLIPSSKVSPLTHAYLGKEYSDKEIQTFISKRKLKPLEIDSKQKLITFVVKQIMTNKVIGWNQGRFEWGPRALGNRSILADARNPKMKDIVNSKVKFRELFRPFAPSVLSDKAHEIFDIPKKFLHEQPFEYMLFVVPVRKDKQKIVPSITHIDGTARPQFVKKQTNPLYYQLINEFYQKTGVPLLLNTSFNLKGEPIVSSPEDAYETFLRSNIDFLVINNYIFPHPKYPQPYSHPLHHAKY
jgi:carbamoyltransferase